MIARRWYHSVEAGVFLRRYLQEKIRPSSRFAKINLLIDDAGTEKVSPVHV